MASNEVVDSDFEQEHVVYKLRDFNSQMVKAWEEAFEKYIPDRIQVNKTICNWLGGALDDVEHISYYVQQVLASNETKCKE